MPNDDPQLSGTPIPGESPIDSAVIPSANEIACTIPASSPEYLQPPRLGVIHLLAWITVMAVLLSFEKTVLRFLDQSLLNYHIELSLWLGLATWFGLCFMAITSAAFVGGGIVLGAKLRHTPGYLQPGHWLILYACLHELVIKTQIIIMLVYSSGTTRPFILRSYFFLIIQGIALCWMALRIPEDGRWKFFFRLWAAVIVYPVVLQILDFLNYKILFFDLSFLSYYVQYEIWWIQYVIGTVLAICLLVVVIRDMKYGPHRDWLHWLGTGVVFLDLINPITFFLLGKIK